jgi:hypothetical protein
MADHWPYSSCGFDEWYFFREPPQDPALGAFCNWVNVSVAQWVELNFPGGFDLLEQLHASRPEVVIGQGHCIYVITRNPEVVADFQELAREGG